MKWIVNMDTYDILPFETILRECYYPVYNHL